MQYRELITKIAEDKQYLAICRKIANNNLYYKDLFQEMLLILLEYDKNKVIEIYKKGQLKWFVIKIFTNLYDRKFKQLYSLGSPEKLEVDDDYNFEKDKEFEDKYKLVKKELKIKDDDDPLWYDKKIFLEYLDKGSIKKLAEDTQINYQSISSTIRKTRNRIKKKYEKK